MLCRFSTIIKDIDECDSDPCQNAGHCSDDINGYTCICTDGYTGSFCEISKYIKVSKLYHVTKCAKEL